MASIIYGCFGKNLPFFKKDITALRKTISRDEKYATVEFNEKNFFVGLMQLDNKVRCCHLPRYNITVIVNGYVYESSYKSCDRDIDIIADAYYRKGDDFAKEVEGSFIAVIYDHSRNKIIIANDVLGLQPCYYLEKDGNFFFCSVAEAFVESGVIDARLNFDALTELFTIGFTVADSTLLDGVYRLKAAAVFTHDGNFLVKDFKTDIFRDGISKSKCNEILKNVDSSLKYSVLQKVKYVKDSGLILALSGGLDSRIILRYLLGLNAKFKAITYDNSSMEVNSNEACYAHMLSEKFGFDHTIEPEELGWVTSFNFCLCRPKLKRNPRISGHAGEIMKGTLYRGIRSNSLKETETTIKRLFTPYFQSKININPFEKVEKEIGRVNHSEYAKRKNIFYVQNISSFFRCKYPSLHRFNRSFLRNRHYPFLSKKFLECIFDIPENQYLDQKFYYYFLNNVMPEYINIPSTTMDVKKLRNKDTIHDVVGRDFIQYCEYLKCFKLFSPLWMKNIFNDSFMTSDEKVGSCLFNIWHDYYFGYRDSVAKMIGSENTWLFS